MSIQWSAHGPEVENRLKQWKTSNFAARLWRKDPTLWFPTPVAEITDRLGWLDLPKTMRGQVEELQAFAQTIKEEGFRHVVLMGMGGSSLAPEVFQSVFGNRDGYPRLLILDSTHPGAVRYVENQIELNRTLFLVSSKSGTTIETLSAFYYFWAKLLSQKKNGGQRFVAITDPGTALEKLAVERGFRRVFQAPEEVGGRYSALSVFGLVPAALIGVNIERILERALAMAEACAPEPKENEALQLGALLGEESLKGRDKVTFVASPALSAFPEWLEQLIAESTGKNGKGIVPVAGERPSIAASYGPDRLFVYLRLEGDENGGLDRIVARLDAAGHRILRFELSDKYDLGGEFFRWEVAVAAAGAVLGIHPFDQSDVQLTKDLARQAMDAKTVSGPSEVSLASDPKEKVQQELTGLLGQRQAGDYLAIQAYLAPLPETTSALQEIRLALRDRLLVATTVGYGPRFLHSTGQLHKGGPNKGIFLQLIDTPTEDLSVPETQYTFGQLVRAQAAGDEAALRQRERRVLHLNLGTDVQGGLSSLKDLVSRENEPEEKTS